MTAQLNGIASTFNADGTKVAFETRATGLGPVDTDGTTDVYVRDLVVGETHLVSVNGAGDDSGDRGAAWAGFSPDGDRGLFVSSSSNLGSAELPRRRPPHENPVPCAYPYVRGLTAGTTTLPARSVTEEGAGGDAGAVLFAGRSTDLVPDDTNQAGDAFIARLPPPPDD